MKKIRALNGKDIYRFTLGKITYKESVFTGRKRIFADGKELKKKVKTYTLPKAESKYC